MLTPGRGEVGVRFRGEQRQRGRQGRGGGWGWKGTVGVVVGGGGAARVLGTRCCSLADPSFYDVNLVDTKKTERKLNAHFCCTDKQGVGNDIRTVRLPNRPK